MGLGVNSRMSNDWEEGDTLMEKFSMNENLENAGTKSETFFSRPEKSVEAEKPENMQSPEKTAAFWERLESELFSTYEERLFQTPKDGERGCWDGVRGEANYIPSNREMREMLAEYGTDRVLYKNAIPEFSKFAQAVVKIEDMSEMRQGRNGNFEQADRKCALQWNHDGKNGRSDWTARDVSDYRRENGYTWHECNDMETCQMIPVEINDYFGHLGGVAECKKADLREDLFDE